MGSDCLSVKGVPAITIGPGRPWDIFFFVSEISTGASKRHFSTAYGSMLYAYRTLGFACAKAVLVQRLSLYGAIDAARFVVVRMGSQTSGAALLREVDASDGTRVLVIELLAVTALRVGKASAGFLSNTHSNAHLMAV
ncbi:hypothetical protein [Dyella agri]|uniref:Uncharacterized protein n=1 Tax=Dyella agri TaxID=1926869 RepID=A0ABW8KFX3_9GAMM